MSAGHGRLYQRHLALVAVPYAAWGSVGVFVRHLDLPATAISAWRLLFATAAVAIVMSIRSELRRFHPGAQVRVLVLIGVVLGLATPLFLLALVRTDIGVAVVVAFSWPLWHTLMAWVLRGERQPPSIMVSLGLCLLGLALVAVRSGSLPTGDDAVGIGAALAASVFAASQIFLFREVHFDIHAITVNLWQSAIAAIMLAPFALRDLSNHPLSASDLAILLLIGGVFTGLGGVMHVAGARRLNPAATAVVSYLEPLVATFLGVVLLDERPRLVGAIGVALVLGSGLFILLRARAQPASHPPSTGTNAPVT